MEIQFFLVTAYSHLRHILGYITAYLGHRCQTYTVGLKDYKESVKHYVYVSAFYVILWAVVSAGYPALLSSSYFERIK